MDGKFVADALATLWLPAIVILMLGTIAGRWVVLGKMGRRRWAAIIPVFSTWEVSEGASGNRALSTVASLASAAYLLSVLLGFGRFFETTWLANLLLGFWLMMQLMVSQKLARSFGAGPGYAAGLVFIPIIAYPLLMTDGKVYLGPLDSVGA